MLSILVAGISAVTLLAVAGLYFRRPKVRQGGESALPFDDQPLRSEIAQLRTSIDHMSQQLSKLGQDREAGASKSEPPEDNQVVRRESPPTPSGAASNSLSDLVREYHDARPSRSSWKDFEDLHSCLRFECTNVRERLSSPETPIRFETSPSGVYLAAAAGNGKYDVFPFFSASPAQLYVDGAMGEVYDFPGTSRSQNLRVVEPAVFTRMDRNWSLQSRGRLEE
jgi:hypothetical protein